MPAPAESARAAHGFFLVASLLSLMAAGAALADECSGSVQFSGKSRGFGCVSIHAGLRE